MYNSGYHELAMQQAKYTIEVFEGEQLVVVPSGSCAAMVKHEFAHLLQDDSDWQRRAQELASRTYELSDFLVNHLGVVDVGARFEGKVAYHFACHLRLLGLKDEVPRLIEAVDGATYIPPERQDQCCGFGGSFAIRYPQISGAMVDDKMACVLNTEADLMVSTDTGCLMNIGGRLHREGHPLNVQHFAELLQQQ